MDSEIKISCPKCGWEPDGSGYWSCNCGNQWNTFETKGKCPVCSVQWQDTGCPGCGQSSKHETWYSHKSDKEKPVHPDQIWLIRRKEIVENKLVSYGIKNSRISYLPYLEFSEGDFQSPYEVGCRILVLWAISYLSYNLNEKGEIESWLKKSLLWDKVSEYEKKIFTEELSQKALVDFSWKIEAVIVLCWAVNLLDNLPDLDGELSNQELDELMAKLPIEENPDFFLSALTYRKKEDIFLENIVNEMITSYLRNKTLSGKKEELKMNPLISFERHYTLNWVRKFSEISEWDETDTST